ncbi:MAG: EAL domain-containing protein [Methylococcaceae bacterium]|nr:MAG: EAL domain-containing protein [Methylococcaceae bacterium]
MPPPDDQRNAYRWPDLFKLAGLALVYVLLAVVVLNYFSASEGTTITVLWLPGGLALATLLLGGFKLWPGVFVGGWMAGFMLGHGVWPSAAMALGNTSESLLCAWLLARNRQFSLLLEHPRDFWHLASTGCIAAIASTAIGAPTLLLEYSVPSWPALAVAMLHWWMGDVLGIVLLTPFCLVWRRLPLGWLERERTIETLACFGLAFLAGQIIFLDWWQAAFEPFAKSFFMFAFVTWSALRFGRHGALLVVGLASVQAMLGTAAGAGVFGHAAQPGVLVNLWFYMLVLSMVGTTLAATIEQHRRIENELRENEAHLRISQSYGGIGTWENDLVNNRQYWSESVTAILGFPVEGHDLTWESFMDAVLPQDRQLVLDAHKAHVEQGKKYDVVYRIVDRAGETRWMRSVGHAERDASGRPVRMRGIVQDVTERKRVEREQQLAATVYQAIGEAIVVADADSRIIAVNPAFTELTGYAEQEAVGQLTSLLKSGRHGVAFYRDMWDALERTGRWQGEIWNRRKNGEIYPEWLSISCIYSEDGAVLRRVAMFSDITEKKLAEQTIWHQANFDSLTWLPNRHQFYIRLEQETKKSQRSGLPLALLFLDLDRFKEINDSMGHVVGDVLLKEAGRRLCECVCEIDMVARLGGDEFTLILTELDAGCAIAAAERIANNLLRRLAEPFALGDDVVYVSASIGITLYPHDADSVDALIKNADQAMYAAKQQGRNRYCYFTASMREAAEARLRLINDMRGALADNQFRVYYQPIVDFATGAIQKAEALIRWQHPTRGLVNPMEFISIAEETGMIIGIGEWVFQQSVRQIAQWYAMHEGEFQISINISPVQFHNGVAHTALLNCFRAAGLPWHSVVVEITEGLLLDADTVVIDQLRALRAAGVQVAIDDFGTGYSSLAYLKKFDIDFLKIDRSFIRNLAPDSEDLALCEAIIIMAHKLGIKVIAEGVETGEQSQLLSAAGCDYGQGYYFARPMPAEEFNHATETMG